MGIPPARRAAIFLRDAVRRKRSAAYDAGTLLFHQKALLYFIDPYPFDRRIAVFVFGYRVYAD